MIIGACGFGSTGSSVISDYLSEYDNVSLMDKIEFGLVTDVDGLIDLAYHINEPHCRVFDSIIAIKRYEKLIERKIPYFQRTGIEPSFVQESTKKFLDSITMSTWSRFDYENSRSSIWKKYFQGYLMINKIIPRMEKKKGKQLACWPMEKVRLSICPDLFYEKAIIHVKEILSGMDVDFSKPIVLDQPFSGNYPQSAFPFFEDPYAIVVDRDPRDNYVFANTRLLGKNHFMAAESVEKFVDYYRTLRNNHLYKKSDGRVLKLNFEDMVYDYDLTTKKVRDFLHFGENPHPKSVFDPSLSIANTQVYKRFPRFSKDIDYIEKELEDYLFDFDKYGKIDIKGEMFFGKSPLHK